MTDDRFITEKDVEKLTQLSRSTLYRMRFQKDKPFPRPLRFSKRKALWRYSGVMTWIADQD